MLSLTMLLLERVGLIIILAYVLMNIPYFKNLMNRRRTWKARWQLCIIFSLFALMSNLTGIVIDHQHSLSGSMYFRLDDDVSLANTRVLTIGVAGLVGGPFVGLFVGVISGIFRVYILLVELQQRLPCFNMIILLYKALEPFTFQVNCIHANMNDYVHTVF